MQVLSFLQLSLLLLIIFNPVSASEQQAGSELAGKVYSVSENGSEKEPLPYASIKLVETGEGTTTDEDGVFRFENLSEGTYTIEVRHIGFRTLQKDIAHSADREGPYSFNLKPYGVDQREFLVSGQRELTSADYQPIQKLDRGDLQERQGNALGEMMEGEPGLSNRSFGSAPSRPVLRGFSGERLLILENGQRMGDIQESAHDHVVSTDPLAIEEIETVRGPASLIYGSNALGGVINMFTNDIPRHASKGWSGQIAGQGATANNMHRTGLRLVRGWNDWAVQGRITHQNAGNVKTPGGTLNGSWGNMLSGSAGFSFDKIPVQGGVSVGINRHNYGLPEFQAAEDPDDENLFREEIPEIELVMDKININGELTWYREGFFEAIELRSNVAHLYQEEIEWEEDGEFDVELSYLQNTFSSSVTMRHGQYGRLENGAAGFNLEYSDVDIGGDEAFHPGQRFVEPSAFLFEEFRITPSLYWQAGIRAGHRWMETKPNHLFPDFEKEHQYFNLSGATGINAQLTSNLEAGAQVARAYRPPSVSELYADGWHAGAGKLELGNEDLEPEVSYGIDGFLEWEGTDLQGEVTGFYTRLNNYIAAFEMPPGCPDTEFRATGPEHARCINYRATDAVKWGFETIWHYRLTNSFTINAQADLVEGRRIDDEGEELPFMPPASMKGGFDYKSDSWEGGLSLRRVLPRKNVAEHELPTEGYYLPRLQAGYNFDWRGNHRILLTLKNPLNQTYYNHLSRVRRYPDAERGPDAPERFPEAGRNLQIGYFWGF